MLYRSEDLGATWRSLCDPAHSPSAANFHGLVPDPTAAGEGLVELNDDRVLQPAENVTPVVRQEVVDRWGADITRLLDAVSARLTTDGLRALNAELASGRPPAAVATAWLAAAQP